ncbi:MAG: uroporphyrinogen decarboxylase family protein [Clostridiaceae bacterium]|nr:uroporphyrinogen decarboxylase family protein [Clostridiaceae bacterium]
MDAKSRIQAAFQFAPTDRIPRYEIFLDGYKENFRKHNNRPPEYDPYDYYDRIDIGAVLADQRGPLYRSEAVLSDDGDTQITRDSWGRRLLQRRSAYFEQALEVVLSDKDKLAALTFDDPEADDKYDAFSGMALTCSRRFAPVSGVLGLFMGSYRMRGEFDYLMDLAEDRPFCQELAGRLADFTTKAGLALARKTKTLDTAIWIYDEFSSTKGPLFSPAIFEAVFYPLYKKMIGSWKAAGLRHVVLHCDGNCRPLLDMLLDAGFDGLQGIAPSTGMWLPDIKKEYGRKLVLIGGMDNIDTLVHGSREEIVYQTAALVEAAQDGGVILGTHSVDGDISVERYNTYSSYLDEHDRMNDRSGESGM